MKKITLLVVMFLFSFTAFAQFPAPYCGPITFTNNEEPITLVQFAGINNSSPNVLAGPAHEDFTAIVGNVTAGQTYPITLKGNTDGNFNTNIAVFIDWNQNGVFTDAGETYNIGSILNSTGLDAVELVGSIEASASALGGNTRMRVVKKFNNSNAVFPDSCNTGGGGWGEAEDYTLSVTAILPCLTGFNFPFTTTSPGTCDGFTPTLISNGSYAGDYFYVSVTTGQTYEFASSVATDFYTISTDDGVTSALAGTQPLTWVSTVTGDIRVHLNTDSACGTEDVERTTTVTCGVLCLTGTLFPAATYTPAICDGTTVNLVVNNAYAGEYANINVLSTNTYTFSSSVATDYITVASADGTTPLAVGTGSVNYTPAADGVVRVYFHTDSSCGTQATNRERNVVCGLAPVVPGCASNPVPADGAIVPAFDDIILSWDVPTTGDPATSYNIYIGDSPTTLNLAANVLTNDPINGGPVGAYSTTIYWQIVPVNAVGEAVGCAVWSFTTEPLPVCLSNNFQFPAGDITPTVCDGVTETLVSTGSWAGDYYNLNVISGETYTMNSSIATDYLTVSTDGNVTAATAGQVPLVWVATVTGVVRVNINTDSDCGTQNAVRTTTVICGVSCLSGNLFPAATFVPTTCDGTTLNEITDDAYAGEYSNVQVEVGQTYTFSSSVATDFFTLSTDGLVAIANGVGPLTWVADYSGVVRVYLHTDAACGEEEVGRFKYVICTPIAPCLTATFGQFPANVFNPSASCDGVTDQLIVNNAYAGEYALVTVANGETYTFSSSVASDIITISADGGATAAASGAGSVTWIATISGDVRFYTHLAGCGDEQVNRSKFVRCGVVSTDTPDYVNLQFPATITIIQGGSDTVYGQVYEGGLTDVTPNIVGQAPGIAAWVGISPEGDNSNPDTWTNWVLATWNAGSVGNNDEYQLTIGADLTPGTYYYATRFSLNNGPYVYGGLGNFWDATNNPSGVLTVNPIPAPANDECTGAIALTPGADFAANPLTTTNSGATTDALVPTCQVNIASNVWYSVVVPASGNITIETQADGGGMTDSVVTAYSGSCSTTLTQVGCDDDLGLGFMSLLSLTGQTPGDTLYISVWRYSFLGGGTNGSFVISAYDGSLSNASFDNASFVAYPNPVKDILNLSYSQNISKVQVINLLGQEVIANSINATQGQIDMSNLPVGTYLVRVTSNELVKTIKVIKE